MKKRPDIDLEPGFLHAGMRGMLQSKRIPTNLVCVVEAQSQGHITNQHILHADSSSVRSPKFCALSIRRGCLMLAQLLIPPTHSNQYAPTHSMMGTVGQDRGCQFGPELR